MSVHQQVPFFHCIHVLCTEVTQSCPLMFDQHEKHYDWFISICYGIVCMIKYGEEYIISNLKKCLTATTSELPLFFTDNASPIQHVQPVPRHLHCQCHGRPSIQSQTSQSPNEQPKRHPQSHTSHGSRLPCPPESRHSPAGARPRNPSPPRRSLASRPTLAFG